MAQGEWSLAAVHDVLADAVPDREMLVCGDVRRTFGEVREPEPGAGGLPRRAGGRPAPGAGRAGAVGERPGRRGPRAQQRPRVHRGDARRVPGPGGAVQRQPALPPGRARVAARTTSGRAPSSTTARYGPLLAEVRRAGRPRPRSTSTTARASRRCRAARAYEAAVATPVGAAARAVARRPLPGLHRRHHRPAEGRAVAPGRHLRLGHGGGRGRHRRVDRHRRGQRRGGALVRPPAAHARRRPVDRLLRAARRLAGPAPRRHAAASTPARSSDLIERERRVPHVDRRRRLRPARSSRSCERGDLRPDLAVRAGHRWGGDQRPPQGGAARARPPPHDHGRLRRVGDRGHGLRRQRPGATDPRPSTPAVGATVVSADRTRFLEPGDDEIGWTARRGRVPLGYLGDPERTEATFPIVDGERVAIPGDRGQRLADGTIRMLGRDSMVVNTGGEKVFVEEVEAVLRRPTPTSTDALVVGRPSERFGQEVVAVVAPRRATPSRPRRAPGVRRRRASPASRRPGPWPCARSSPATPTARPTTTGPRSWPSTPSTPPAADRSPTFWRRSVTLSVDECGAISGGARARGPRSGRRGARRPAWCRARPGP